MKRHWWNEIFVPEIDVHYLSREDTFVRHAREEKKNRSSQSSWWRSSREGYSRFEPTKKRRSKMSEIVIAILFLIKETLFFENHEQNASFLLCLVTRKIE